MNACVFQHRVLFIAFEIYRLGVGTNYLGTISEVFWHVDTGHCRRLLYPTGIQAAHSVHDFRERELKQKQILSHISTEKLCLYQHLRGNVH